MPDRIIDWKDGDGDPLQIDAHEANENVGHTLTLYAPGGVLLARAEVILLCGRLSDWLIATTPPDEPAAALEVAPAPLARPHAAPAGTPANSVLDMDPRGAWWLCTKPTCSAIMQRRAMPTECPNCKTTGLTEHRTLDAVRAAQGEQWMVA